MIQFFFEVLIGGLLQLIVQFPALRRVGYHFRPDFAWRDPGVRRISVKPPGLQMRKYGKHTETN